MLQLLSGRHWWFFWGYFYIAGYWENYVIMANMPTVDLFEFDSRFHLIGGVFIWFFFLIKTFPFMTLSHVLELKCISEKETCFYDNKNKFYKSRTKYIYFIWKSRKQLNGMYWWQEIKHLEIYYSMSHKQPLVYGIQWSFIRNEVIIVTPWLFNKVLDYCMESPIRA